MTGHLESAEATAAAQRFSADGVRFVRVDHAVTDWEWRECAAHA